MTLTLPHHHAVLVVTPDREGVFATLQKTFTHHAHKHLRRTVLDIDTAREMISWSKAALPTDDTHERVYVVSFHTMTHPAQNALLKVLEEPQQGVRFVLVTSNKERIIDTVLSRVQTVVHETPISDDMAYAFLKASPAARMKLSGIVELLEREDEEGRKDREAVKGFILALVDVLHKEHVEARYVEETLAMASYASDPSASGKAIVEYLSLLLPQIK